MKNPYSGHKILRYEVRIKQNTKDGWHLLHKSKTRKAAESFIIHGVLRGSYLLSRMRWIGNSEHREDLRESAKG